MLKTFTKRPLRACKSFGSSSRSDSSERTARTELEKFVSFSDKIRVSHTISKNDYSAEEKLACWFSNEENQDIAKRCAKQIRKMERGEALLDKKYCSRGLEGHTRVGYTHKTQNRSDSIHRVLAEQDAQLRERTSDDEAISVAYREVSSSCLLWAQVQALRDQKEAEEYLDAAFEPCRAAESSINDRQKVFSARTA